MKTKKKLLKITLVAISIMISTSLFAQFSEVGNIMSTGVDDAEKILEAYVSPFSNGMGAALSGGWYNTAKPHKLGGFDITFTANVVIIPSADKTFDPNDLNLGKDGGFDVTIDDDESPTVAGKNEEGAQVTYQKDILGTPTTFTQFNLPKGSNFGYSFMPMVQVGVGLMKGTEINGRYSPTLNYGKNGKLGLWGVGIKHDVKQWIPGLEKLPILNISVQGGYTKMFSVNDLDFQPEFYSAIATIQNNYSSATTYDDQQLVMNISNTTANLLVSANLPVLAVYGGVGFSNTKTNLKLEGTYPLAALNAAEDAFEISESTAKKDPIDMEMKNTDIRLNAGFRIKMAVITLHFDYTYANYSIATAGLGVSLR